MKKQLTPLTISLIFLIYVLVLSAVVIPYQNDFKVGECAKDQINFNTRKITKIYTQSYKYCIFRNNKCKSAYSMRIKDFDRVMLKTNCLEEK